MKYCTKCGKPIEYDSTICVECVAAAKAAADNIYRPQYHEPHVPINLPVYVGTPAALEPIKDNSNVNYDKMAGFGRALTSTILAFVAFIMSVALVGEIDPEAISAWIILVLPLAILSLVFGIISIRVFTRLKNVKPIPALILGICGTSFSGFSLLLFMAWLGI